MGGKLCVADQVKAVIQWEIRTGVMTLLAFSIGREVLYLEKKREKVYAQAQHTRALNKKFRYKL